jgi:hypothetical protein
MDLKRDQMMLIVIALQLFSLRMIPRVKPEGMLFGKPLYALRLNAARRVLVLC